MKRSKKNRIFTLHGVRICIIFLLLGGICSCSSYLEPKFSREIVPREHEETLCREELIRSLNGIVMSKVSFDNTSIAEALDWLAQNSGVGISSLYFETNFNVTVSMTNVTFLNALDHICEISDRYWGFAGRVLMTLPKKNVSENPKWRLKENK